MSLRPRTLSPSIHLVDVRLHVLLIVAAALLVMPFAGAAIAEVDAADPDEPVESVPADETEGDAAADDANDAALALGAEVYTQACASCHQAGGVGVIGQFPPLLENPNVMDTDYLVETIANGRQGEIVVLGETYNGRMPAFSTLPDDEVAALVTYIQSGFDTPAVVAVEPAVIAPDRGLPALTDYTYYVAFLIAAGVMLLVLAPRITSAHDRLEMPWLDAWLKTGVIVVGFVVFTIFVPNWALETDTVAKLDRPLQDFIGTALWTLGLAAGLWSLWYAHRDDRI